MVPDAESSGALAKVQERSAVFRNIADSLAGIDFPLAEVAQLSLHDHASIL